MVVYSPKKKRLLIFTLHLGFSWIESLHTVGLAEKAVSLTTSFP
jgi:hypothetical protein